MDKTEATSKAWAKDWTDIAEELGVDLAKGLGPEEVAKLRKRYGRNVLREKEKKPTLLILTEQLKSPIILLLAIAGGLSFGFSEIIEGIAIIAVIIFNSLIGFVTELKATRSMEALRELGKTKALVRREGQLRHIQAEELVPGDVLIIESGTVIAADIRLTETNKLQADESALTGESVPVSKKTDTLAEDTTLAERKNMLFKGTAVTMGSGEGIVTATGMNTELGKISTMVEEAEEERTPLEKRLAVLGRKLIWVTIIMAAAMGLSGIIAGKDILLVVKTAIALAVAAIPEGLPIVANIALARGMWLMAKKNALVNRLASVETLGATNLICADKTGTLTENRMTVRRFDSQGEPSTLYIDPMRGEDSSPEAPTREDSSREGPSQEELDPVSRRAFEVGVLCNNAELTGEHSGLGDPLEVALLEAGASFGMERDSLRAEYPEVEEVAFDTKTKKMATVHRRDGALYYAVKGATEEILAVSDRIASASGDQSMDEDLKEEWERRNTEMAATGLRVIALADKRTEEREEAYRGLRFLGLIGMIDPPRQEIKSALQTCRQAGIRVVMVTGDHAVTSREIAKQLGLITEENEEEVSVIEGKMIDEYFEDTDKHNLLLRTEVFARVSPKQKLEIIELHQENNSIVAMTGDGVNDAPALKKADIGVAMGRRGTEVAKEAADMVLQDDAFSTIVSAVKQGRIIFANIRKFVLYLLSCNLSEILTVGIASFFAVPLPLLPLQILFLNLVTGVFPALALGAGTGTPGVMKQPARDPKEPVIGRRHWLIMSAYSMLISASVLIALFLSLFVLDFGEGKAVSISFLTLGFAHLWHVFNMRERGSDMFRNDITRNPWVWGALLLCIILLLSAAYLPGLSTILEMMPPDIGGWLLVIGLSLVPLIVVQPLKYFLRDKARLF